MQYQYVSIHSIFSKIIRDVTDQFNEDDVIEWCGEALEFIGAVQSYEDTVAFVEIKNHQGILPKGLHLINQVARNTGFSNYKNCTPLTVSEQSDCCPVQIGHTDVSCVKPTSEAVWLDCNGKPIVAYDLAYYRPYFNLKVEHEGWSNSTFYRQNFTPVRLADHTFFNTLVDSEYGTAYSAAVDSYTLIQGKYIRTSFKTGQLCISFKKQVTDTEGYPMIPEEISYKTAITKYIQYKMADKDFQNGRDGAERRLAKYESDWQWYCSQASNADKMIFGIDEHQNFLDQRSTLIPNNKKYFGFFGNLSNLGMQTRGNMLERSPNSYNTEDMYFHNTNRPSSLCGGSAPTGDNTVVGKTLPIKTVTGDTLVAVGSTYKWIDPKYANTKIEVFANTFNRYLTPTEYTEIPTGGVIITVGGPYTIDDVFKMIPNGIK